LDGTTRRKGVQDRFLKRAGMVHPPAKMVDLVLQDDYLDYMKVKIGQLKTHLSRYVQELRAGGEPIEVCVRENTVAYLTSSNVADGKPRAESESLRAGLERSGLTVSQWGTKPGGPIVPGRAADGDTTVDSVQRMRSEKGW
jgi:antitoxin (DNA-binding transcriptional repressor) of toxin-antitoxin stability system